MQTTSSIRGMAVVAGFLTGKTKELKGQLADARAEVEFWQKEVDTKFLRSAEEAADATKKWADHVRQLRAEIASGDALLQRLPGWENFRKEGEKLRDARIDRAIAAINEEFINGPLGDPNFDPGKVLAGIRQALGELPTALPPQGTKESADEIRKIEEQLAIDRARLEGRTIDAILIEEARRVEDTLKHLESIAASEAEMQRARETLAKQTEIKIAEENRRKVEEMAGHWDSFIDRVIFGAESWKDFFKGMLREMLGTFLKFIGRMIIAWISGLEKMKDIWEAFKKSLPGGGGDLGSVIIQNLIPRFAHGGMVDDAFRAMRAVHSGDGRLLAMLDEGEAVLNPGAVRLMGAGRIEALNQQGRGVSSFQGGGLVGPSTSLGVKSAQGGFHGQPVNITINIDGRGSNPEAIANFTIRKLKRELRDQGLRLGT